MMKRKALVLLLIVSMLMTSCGTKPQENTSSQPSAVDSSQQDIENDSADNQEDDSTDDAQQLTEALPEVTPVDIVYYERPTLLAQNFQPKMLAITARPSPYQDTQSGLSNVYQDGFYLSEKEQQILSQNGFVLSNSYQSEFFQTYENNRYANRANYVTVDSMMHTYHLYFSHLLKKIEREHLRSDMLDVSQQMLQKAQEHYNVLQGTEWEEAAKRELAFFAVGTCLLEPDAVIPETVSEEVTAELSLISSAGISDSFILDDVKEDYSQYIPRGYYDSSEDLKQYFKAMMWYGRMGFRQDNDTLNRASVLITIGMDGEIYDKWAKVYAVTSFFAGVSDDFGYCELKPLVDAVYGEECTVEDLVGKDSLWQLFESVSKQLPAPVINSVPVYASDSDEEKAAAQKGFRFMGQRFSIDEACFTQLTERSVSGRILPDALDFPAALGSETAYSILEQQGDTSHPNYPQQMEKLRSTIEEAPMSTWTSSLYSAWIYTLTPLLEEKDSSYPPFMLSDEWKRKSLMSFEGSYSELKHDTILYSKQMMGEMGGGEMEQYDDRGYVEAEPAVFSRLQALVSATATGLDGYGMINEQDKQNLNLLADLSGKLEVIAEKELNGELPTAEEFDLIRSYGGQLEHFWEEVMNAEFPDEQFHTPQLHPAPIVADIATDPNGTCLEVATGKPLEIKVIVEVDGMLKVASGAVYSFYQFEYPLSDRLTDSKWRQMIGAEVGEDGYYSEDESIQYPSWYSDLIPQY